jgi:hypothetical protein
LGRFEGGFIKILTAGGDGREAVDVYGEVGVHGSESAKNEKFGSPSARSANSLVLPTINAS